MPAVALIFHYPSLTIGLYKGGSFYYHIFYLSPYLHHRNSIITAHIYSLHDSHSRRGQGILLCEFLWVKCNV